MRKTLKLWWNFRNTKKTSLRNIVCVRYWIEKCRKVKIHDIFNQILLYLSQTNQILFLYSTKNSNTEYVLRSISRQSSSSTTLPNDHYWQWHTPFRQIFAKDMKYSSACKTMDVFDGQKIATLSVCMSSSSFPKCNVNGRFSLLLSLSLLLTLSAFNLAFLSNLCNCCHCLQLFVLDATYTVSMISSEMLQTVPLKKINQTIYLPPRQLLCFMHFNCNLLNSSCLSKPMAFIRIDATQTLENCIFFNISWASVIQMFTKNCLPLSHTFVKSIANFWAQAQSVKVIRLLSENRKEQIDFVNLNFWNSFTFSHTPPYTMQYFDFNCRHKKCFHFSISFDFIECMKKGWTFFESSIVI